MTFLCCVFILQCFTTLQKKPSWKWSAKGFNGQMHFTAKNNNFMIKSSAWSSVFTTCPKDHLLMTLHTNRFRRNILKIFSNTPTYLNFFCLYFVEKMYTHKKLMIILSKKNSSLKKITAFLERGFQNVSYSAKLLCTAHRRSKENRLFNCFTNYKVVNSSVMLIIFAPIVLWCDSCTQIKQRNAYIHLPK